MEKEESLPLISIIVPVYNVKHYLDKCLHSISKQTYTNLEIIVVDDGSTDGSGEICDLLAKEDKRIKVIHQPNAGQSAARNRGLAIARGELLGFVDSDDWIEADMYQTLHRLMVQGNADIAICTLYRDKGGKSVAKYSSGRQYEFTHDEAIRALVVDKHVRNYVVDKLFKRRLFDGIVFPVNRIFEDLAISYQVFYRAERIVMQDVPKYHYVIRTGSTMQSKYDPRKEYQLFQAVCEQCNFVRDMGIWDKTPIFVIRRGLHLLNHLALVPPSAVKEEVMQKVLGEMHKYDGAGWRQIGVTCAIRRWAIMNHPSSYGAFYRTFRSLFKSKRHRIENG